MDTLTDPKLLARVRRLIEAEQAGFVREGTVCLEPGCSCGLAMCGPFRTPAVRCTNFEQVVLPLDPDLEAAYWAHLERGESLRVRRCQWPRCRREVATVGPNAQYCAAHARLRAKETQREASRRYRQTAEAAPAS